MVVDEPGCVTVVVVVVVGTVTIGVLVFVFGYVVVVVVVQHGRLLVFVAVPPGALPLAAGTLSLDLVCVVQPLTPRTSIMLAAVSHDLGDSNIEFI